MWQVDVVWISAYDEPNRKVSKSFPRPNWDESRGFLETLTLDCHVQIAIDGPRQYVMTLEGSSDRFIVCTIGEDMGPYELLGSDPSDETVPILVGGIIGDVPRRFVVRREQAPQAAEYFFHHGKIDPTLSWHLD